MSRSVLLVYPRSGREIDQAAAGLLQEFQPEALSKPQAVDVERIFEFYPPTQGMTTDYDELPVGMDAVTDVAAMQCVVSAALAERASQRRYYRSTLGHEIGHIKLHLPEFLARREVGKLIQNGNNGMKLYRQETIPTFRNPEWQADHFSGGLLMPANSVRIAFAAGAGIEELSELFDVHPAFVRSRLKALKLEVKN